MKLRWNSRRLLINTRPPILEYFAIFLIETIYKIKPQILIPTCQRIRVFFLPITHITQTHQLSVHHLRRTLSSSCNKSSNSMKCGYATVFISIIICVGLAVFNLTVQELTFLENLLQFEGPGAADACAEAHRRLMDADLFFWTICGREKTMTKPRLCHCRPSPDVPSEG